MGGKSKAPVTTNEKQGYFSKDRIQDFERDSLGPSGYTSKSNFDAYLRPEWNDTTNQGIDRRLAAAQDPSAAEGYAGDYAGQANSLYNRGADIYQGLSDPIGSVDGAGHLVSPDAATHHRPFEGIVCDPCHYPRLHMGHKGTSGDTVAVAGDRNRPGR